MHAQRKWKLTEWHEIFVNYVSDKERVWRIIKCNKKKTTHWYFNGQMIWIDISPKIYKRSTSTWKTPNIMSLKECKSKPQWDITSYLTMTKKSTNNMLAGMWRKENSSSTQLVGFVSLCRHYRKTVWRFLKKLGIELPYDTATLLLSIYLKKIKT